MLFRSDPVPFSLRTALADALRPFEPKIKEQHLALTVAVDDNVPECVVGDALRFRQVLVNLVGNAIKFTHEGPIRVVLSCVERRERTAGIELAVTDTGIGIPAEKRGSIFHAFTQADGSTTRRYGGTGLGLAICSQLVDLMGGRIWVESEEGRGSTFKVWLTVPVVERSEEHTSELQSH